MKLKNFKRFIVLLGVFALLGSLSSLASVVSAADNEVQGSAVVEGVNYRIVGRTSGKLLDPSTSSTVVQMGLNKVTSEKWNFVAVSDGYYKIVNSSSNKVMDVSADGIILADDSGSNSQNWGLVNAVGGYFKIVNRDSGKVLDVLQNSTADGAKIIAYNDTNASNQQWYIAREIKGNVTYTLVKSANPTADQLDAYERITRAMDTTVKYYNNFTDFSKHLTIYYRPGVPTAEGSFNGTISFGTNRGFMVPATAMHETGHTMGVGQNSVYASLMSTRIWQGANATAELRSITGKNTDEIHGDRNHFWPYGLNQASEVKSDADYINHCRIVYAMKKDGM
ncbi:MULTISPECIES: RICIN domain-containing protein [unclassified Paenibacillus]|uniref:RICIN domain-containing protein n=1 Tax=unclassified Paenibacillus TaxID=185978 RepID=UPI0024BAD8E2|nr:RICIN domain-containing protein [Paenibacillus sp. RC334]